MTFAPLTVPARTAAAAATAAAAVVAAAGGDEHAAQQCGAANSTARRLGHDSPRTSSVWFRDHADAVASAVPLARRSATRGGAVVPRTTSSQHPRRCRAAPCSPPAPQQQLGAAARRSPPAAARRWSARRSGRPRRRRSRRPTGRPGTRTPAASAASSTPSACRSEAGEDRGRRLVQREQLARPCARGLAPVRAAPRADEQLDARPRRARARQPAARRALEVKPNGLSSLVADEARSGGGRARAGARPPGGRRRRRRSRRRAGAGARGRRARRARPAASKRAQLLGASGAARRTAGRRGGRRRREIDVDALRAARRRRAPAGSRRAASAARDAAQALDDRGLGEEGGDDADRARAAGRERARRGVGLVAELVDRLEHAPRVGSRHPRGAVEHARDGAHPDARPFRHLRDGHARPHLDRSRAHWRAGPPPSITLFLLQKTWNRATGRFHACSALSRSLARRVPRRRAERPRDAPGGARGVRARARAWSAATRRSACASSASSPSCATRCVALYGDDPRFAGAVATRCCDAIAATAAARDPELRALDHEREITPGLAAARAGGRLRRLRRPLRRDAGRRARAAAVPARARRQLPAPDAAAGRAAGAQRRRLRGRRLRRGRARAGHDGRPARARRPTCARPGWRCASTSCSTTPRASTRGRRPRWRATRASSPSTARSRTATEPDALRARRCPRSSPTSRPGSFTWVPELGRWVWTTFNALPVGPRLHEPRGLRGDGRGDARRSPPPASTCCASTPSPFLWKRVGTDCQNQPEVHELLQAFRAAMRIAAPGGRLQGRGDRRAARPRAATSATGRHEGKECDLAYHNVLMVLLWSALASGRVALMTRTLQAMPPRPAGRRLGDLRALPRRHRLGDHARRTPARGRARTRHLHRRFLADFYAGEFPGSFARGARFQPDPRTGEARTSGTARVAGRARVRAGAATSSRRELAIRRVLLLLRASRSPTAGCR